MSKFKKQENIIEGKKVGPDQYLFFCPGCKYDHAVELKEEGGNHRFNMDLDNPTLSPSFLVDFIPGKRCHSYIRQGMIIFMSDCDHHLAGRTVELPDYETEMEKLKAKK